MAKNTNSNTFRKIDVDQFNEDNFRDEDCPTTPLEGSSGAESERETEVANLLSNGQHAEALRLGLASAPIGNKNQDEKVELNCARLFFLSA
jgi:actin related protein 2/3 complex subunit 5